MKKKYFVNRKINKAKISNKQKEREKKKKVQQEIVSGSFYSNLFKLRRPD